VAGQGRVLEAELEKFIPFGQGTLSMTPALRELEVKLLNASAAPRQEPDPEHVRHNAVVIGDPARASSTRRRRAAGSTA
jgi:hypothetical protein